MEGAHASDSSLEPTSQDPWTQQSTEHRNWEGPKPLKSQHSGPPEGP